MTDSTEIDEVFYVFAAAFAGRIKDADPICFPKKLNREALDLSLDSLKLVDEYLLYLHRNKDRLNENERDSTILYGGAYVGEVIRCETENYFHWIDYNDYVPRHPELQSLLPVRCTPTCAFLVDPEDGISLPLKKIARFIADGEAESVHFFAHCDIEKSKRR